MQIKIQMQIEMKMKIEIHMQIKMQMQTKIQIEMLWNERVKAALSTVSNQQPATQQGSSTSSPLLQ